MTSRSEFTKTDPATVCERLLAIASDLEARASMAADVGAGMGMDCNVVLSSDNALEIVRLVRVLHGDESR